VCLRTNCFVGVGLSSRKGEEAPFFHVYVVISPLSSQWLGPNRFLLINLGT
jgi:hypothetical protein